MKRRSYVYPLLRRILCAGIDWYIISLLQSAAVIAVYYWQSGSVNMSNHLFDLSFSNAVIACILTVFLYFSILCFSLHAPADRRQENGCCIAGSLAKTGPHSASLHYAREQRCCYCWNNH